MSSEILKDDIDNSVRSVCSGAHYARFFADMKHYLEHPELLEKAPEKIRFDQGLEYHEPKISNS